MAYTPNGDGTIHVVAVEAERFPGEVFLCFDASSSDVLGVRAFDTTTSVTGWSANRPGPPCDLRGDTAGLMARSAGVHLTLSADGARVAGVVLFDPSFYP